MGSAGEAADRPGCRWRADRAGDGPRVTPAAGTVQDPEPPPGGGGGPARSRYAPSPRLDSSPVWRASARPYGRRGGLERALERGNGAVKSPSGRGWRRSAACLGGFGGAGSGRTEYGQHRLHQRGLRRRTRPPRDRRPRRTVRHREDVVQADGRARRRRRALIHGGTLPVDGGISSTQPSSHPQPLGDARPLR
ncbi:MAG: hypothetical protein QOE59_1591 [Actinomycetota bacterium]|nr:hypothetical protein [Actinomycetota bacterium]